MYEAKRYEADIESCEYDKAEREMYRAAFSGLHASEKLKREEFYMKSKKPVLRVNRMLAICAIIALLVCAMSVGAYAASDGETANPISLLRVYLNGEEISGSYTQNEDGSYDIDLGEGASLSYYAPSEDGNDVNYRVDINTEEAEDSVEIDISDAASANTSDDGKGEGEAAE